VTRWNKRWYKFYLCY